MEYNLHLPLWPRQKQALLSEATEQLFGGASEGGKSYFTRVAIILACLECEGLQTSLIRKKSSDILSNHLEGDKGFRSLLYPLSSQGIVEVTQKGIRFPRGSICNFKHCQDERQFDSAQGNENQMLCLDEAPQIEERLIRAFRSWCRITDDHKSRLPPFWQKKLPWVLYTGNPTGRSVGFFRRHFVKARPMFAMEEVDGFLRQYVPSKAEDNESVNLHAHKRRLAAIGDAVLAKALDEGDWDSIAGEYFPEWDEERHLCPDFEIPHWWHRYRGFDWGSGEPFCCLWAAVSDGEQFESDVWLMAEGIFTKQRKTLWFPRGAIIIYREWYGCDPQDTAKGLWMRNKDIAKGILERSPGQSEQNLRTVTDSYVFPDRGEDEGQTIAKTFEANGVPLTLGKTARVTGWSQFRGRLIGEHYNPDNDIKIPMLFLFNSLKYGRDYIPTLPRHPNEARKEDAAESGEATHWCDAARLICMANEIIYDKAPPSIAEEARRIAASLEQRMTFNDALKMSKRLKRGANGKGW